MLDCGLCPIIGSRVWRACGPTGSATLAPTCRSSTCRSAKTPAGVAAIVFENQPSSAAQLCAAADLLAYAWLIAENQLTRTTSTDLDSFLFCVFSDMRFHTIKRQHFLSFHSKLNSRKYLPSNSDTKKYRNQFHLYSLFPFFFYIYIHVIDYDNIDRQTTQDVAHLLRIWTDQTWIGQIQMKLQRTSPEQKKYHCPRILPLLLFKPAVPPLRLSIYYQKELGSRGSLSTESAQQQGWSLSQ